MRNLKNIIGWVLLFCAVSLESPAQVKSTNKLLAELVEQLPDIRLDEGFSGEVKVATISEAKPIIIHRNSEGVIDHVGIKFFDRAILEKHPSPVYHFIERYFLELLLLPGQEDIKTKLRMERVNITSEVFSLTNLQKGLKEMVERIPENFSICITCNNNRYSASCMDDDNRVLSKIVFPVSYQLISGFNKLEAENSVYSALLAYSQPEYRPLTAVELSSYKEDLFCANEDYYVTEDIVSTSYYNKVGEEFLPILSSSFLKESVYNLFNTGYDWGVKAEVEQNLYGGKRFGFEVPLSKLTSFLLDQHCSLYTGIRKYDKKTVVGVLMAVNMELGYQHILMFTFDKHLIEQPQAGNVKIKMYSYVPIHNISSLF